MTQLEQARAGKISDQMKSVAEKEGVSPSSVQEGIKNGTLVIPANRLHAWLEPAGIGVGLRIKVNANLGTSSDRADLDFELEKLRVALEVKADTIMDLSTGGDIDGVRKALIKECPVPLGTVPIYQAGIQAIENYEAIPKMTADEIFQAIEAHAQDGVDFLTVHCGVTQDIVRKLKESGRLMQMVSRGGTFLACWILVNEQENPLYAQFDRLLEIAREYDVTLSLGDGLRPGCLADATDRPQVQELIVLGELVARARAAGVQSMVEGPGHLPLDQIAANVMLEKRLCQGAPFYVLGPLVTDIAPGYDHITAAIGGAVAGMAGADFLCYVTPSEHLGLPGVEEVRQGVVATRIAAHAADIVRLGERALQWDNQMSQARCNLDWEKQFQLSIDPQRAKQVRQEPVGEGPEGCTMCGEYCVFKLLT